AGAAPIVVIGTTRDPATPFSEAVALSNPLEAGVLISRDGDGHTGYASGNDCVDNAVEDYLVKGTGPQDGLKCYIMRLRPSTDARAKSSQLKASSQPAILPSRTSKVPRTQNDDSHLPLRSTSVRSVNTTSPFAAAWWMVTSTPRPCFSASISICPTRRPLTVGSMVFFQTMSPASSVNACSVSGRASSRKNSRTVCSGSIPQT